MDRVPYRHTYRRSRPAGGPPAAGYLPNPACHWTDQGGQPDPADLAWCLRRCWRVLYYTARQAAGQPLWDGVEEFEAAMVKVLLLLTSAYEPIAPLRRAKTARQDGGPSDGRPDRVCQPSCRVLRTPVFPEGEWEE